MAGSWPHTVAGGWWLVAGGERLIAEWGEGGGGCKLGQYILLCYIANTRVGGGLMGHGKGNNQIKFLDETDHRIEKSFIILERRYREYASKFQTKILILSTVRSPLSPSHQLSRPQRPSHQV